MSEESSKDDNEPSSRPNKIEEVFLGGEEETFFWCGDHLKNKTGYFLDWFYDDDDDDMILCQSTV